MIACNRIENGAAGAYGIFVFVPYVPVVVRDNRISQARRTVAVHATCNDIRSDRGRTVIAGGLASYADYPGLPPAGGGTPDLVFPQNNFRGRGSRIAARGRCADRGNQQEPRD